ncbi:ABC transporter ATPase [Lacticaseibacillus brantae DSM 23927]|uniref:ABC transporter ATPase n=1 Tax=Lacticaseibacillus brantae DSM 23927 TaxID=1423727 RepID=A0A0R2AZF7_9LACO|nr:ABC transporter ATPase [Lacticaseibacillus brantae DSM 23927]
MEVQHITKYYGSRSNRFAALNNLSFKIDAGEFVGIMGPSGAGKSTLLNIMATIDQPSAGKVLIGNQNLGQMTDAELANFRREKLGFIFQDFNLLPDMTVQENIALPLTLGKTVAPDLLDRVKIAAEILGLSNVLTRYPEALSVGQRQRVASARAIITRPELIFADEPTGSLDSLAATDLLRYLTKLNLEEDVTIMMVTHDAFTASYCNRIIFIKDGTYFAEVTRRGSRQEFFDRIIDMEATISGGHQHVPADRA